MVRGLDLVGRAPREESRLRLCGVPVDGWIHCYGLVVVADPLPERPFLGPGASPASVRACLLPEDRVQFSRAYAAAIQAGDVPAQHDAIERWRGIAILQADPERYAQTVRRVAERKTGRPVPDDQPLSVTRRAAGM